MFISMKHYQSLLNAKKEAIAIKKSIEEDGLEGDFTYILEDNSSNEYGQAWLIKPIDQIVRQLLDRIKIEIKNVTE